VAALSSHTTGHTELAPALGPSPYAEGVPVLPAGTDKVAGKGGAASALAPGSDGGATGSGNTGGGGNSTVTSRTNALPTATKAATNPMDGGAARNSLPRVAVSTQRRAA
jgi:hypothetical protein